jgi:Tfp pilus assembly protein PilF
MMAEGVPLIPAEEAFRKALQALERRCYKEAVGLFQTAIEAERQDGSAKNPKMKYLSFLGLALTLSQGRSDEGQTLCEQAVKRDFFDADLFCNLGIVSLRNRQRAAAFEAFRKGLTLRPGYRRILDELERYERRGQPVFEFIPRDHPINRLAGLVRYRLRQLLRSAPATEG